MIPLILVLSPIPPTKRSISRSRRPIFIPHPGIKISVILHPASIFTLIPHPAKPMLDPPHSQALSSPQSVMIEDFMG